eukprot:382343_1
MKKYKNKDNENQIRISDLEEHAMALADRHEMKKILDGIDDDTAVSDSNQCISISVKYKDKLFKNKSHTIKVHQSIRLHDFVDHLSDSINIDPNLIQLQHDTTMIDVRDKDTMNCSLAQL